MIFDQTWYQTETGKLLTTKDLSNLKMKIMKGREKQGEESKESNMDQSHYQEEIQDDWLHETFWGWKELQKTLDKLWIQQ